MGPAHTSTPEQSKAKRERETERGTYCGTYSSPRKPQNNGGPYGPGSLNSSSNPKEEEEDRERECESESERDALATRHSQGDLRRPRDGASTASGENGEQNRPAVSEVFILSGSATVTPEATRGAMGKPRTARLQS